MFYLILTESIEVHEKRDFKPFFQWLRENDFPGVDSLDVSYSPKEGYTLVTKKDIPQNSLAFEVRNSFLALVISHIFSGSHTLYDDQ